MGPYVAFAGALATAIAKAGPLARSRTAVGHFRGQDSKKDKRSVNNMRASDVSCVDGVLLSSS